MKNLLACLFVVCVLVQPGWVFAGHLKTIKDLPVWESFVEIGRSQVTCGWFSVHEYENSTVRWKRYLFYTSNTVPTTLLTFRFDRITGEFELWLDRDRDGHVDEYYSRKPDLETNIYPTDVFREQYPTLCDAVK